MGIRTGESYIDGVKSREQTSGSMVKEYVMFTTTLFSNNQYMKLQAFTTCSMTPFINPTLHTYVRRLAKGQIMLFLCRNRMRT